MILESLKDIVKAREIEKLIAIKVTASTERILLIEKLVTPKSGL